MARGIILVRTVIRCSDRLWKCSFKSAGRRRVARVVAKSWGWVGSVKVVILRLTRWARVAATVMLRQELLPMMRLWAMKLAKSVSTARVLAGDRWSEEVVRDARAVVISSVLLTARSGVLSSVACISRRPSRRHTDSSSSRVTRRPLPINTDRTILMISL